MTNHTKYKHISTNVEISNPILGYGGKIVVHNITKDLKMFKLITSHNIIIHHEEINLTYFCYCHKIMNEDILSLNFFYKRIDCFQQY
jgi:hypothetical protein